MSDPSGRSITGRIFEIQRFSIHDGPGIRTTVFLKGCPLRCIWCHNPEGVDPRPILSFQPDKCIGCGYCCRVCPQGAHQMVAGCHIFHREACLACGRCTIECYARALELVGHQATVEEVLKEVLQDRFFYQSSGGGMTLSGGEPTMQIDFTEALLKAAKKEGLHCCIETCGFANRSRFERILPYVDLFLYDIKELNNDRHIEFTGMPNGPILKNLRMLHRRGQRIRLRLPTIPGYNDREDHFAAVAKLVHSLPHLCGVEIMPYHRLGTSKIDRLGLSHENAITSEPPDQNTVSCWIDQLEKLGVAVINR